MRMGEVINKSWEKGGGAESGFSFQVRHSSFAWGKDGLGMKVSSLCPLGVSWRNVAKNDLRICFRPHYSAQGEKSWNSKATNRATTKSARKKAQPKKEEGKGESWQLPPPPPPPFLC